MNKRETARERHQREKQARKRQRLSPWDTSSSVSLPSEDSGLEPFGRLRIVRLTGVSRKEDVRVVANVLTNLGKPSEWAETAHFSDGRARLPIYTGYSKVEANEVSRQLEEAGAKLVRC